MQIFVKTDTGKTLTIDVEASDTISEVRGKIYDKGGFDSDRYFHLKYGSRYLTNESTVSACGIEKESTLYIIWPFPGPAVDALNTSSGLDRASRGD